MSLEIKGLIPLSTADWEGKLATVLFLPGCNFRCGYCQNRDLILSPDKIPTISWREVKKHLQERKDWLDGVVIGGGEPTINNNLKTLVFKIKELGYQIKLDTNGAKPQVLLELLEKNLLDCVALDIKTAFKKYPSLVGKKVDDNEIKESINLILRFRVDYEFRTTIFPGGVEKEDILEIAKYLTRLGVKNYILQQFDPKVTLSPKASQIKPYSEQFLQNLAQECSKYLPTRLRL